MADGYEDRLRQGRELREMRRQRADRDSPCARCSRDYCPKVCFPKRDFDRNRRGGKCPPLQGGGRNG